MNLVDILLVLIVVIATWAGWQKGFILSCMDLITWVGSLIGSFWLYPYIADFMQKNTPQVGVWIIPVAFLLALVFIRLLLHIVFSRLLSIMPVWAHTNIVNRVFGIAPGFVNGMLIAGIAALVLTVVPISDNVSGQLRNSKVSDRLTASAEWAETKLAPVIDTVVNRTLCKLTIEPSSEKAVKLSFTTANFAPRPDLEAAMLQLVNNERAQNGLRALAPDSALGVVARAHAADMFKRGYFSHYTPEGKSPFDRMHDAGIQFISAGENLALAQTLNTAHAGLMHSPGHRANILNPLFGHVGIAVLDGGVHGLMIAQEFSN